MVLVAFGSILGCQVILYAEFMVVCARLELTIQLGYLVLEVESHSATIISWIHSRGHVHWIMLTCCLGCALSYPLRLS